MCGCAGDRKSTRLNSSHSSISYAVFCLKKTNRIHPALLLFLHIIPQPPRSTLFPYTTLFRSLLFASARVGAAQNPSRPWRTITTTHFRVHFTPELDTLARRAAVHAESAYVRLRRRSEEHTSELQSQFHLVCRLLLEKNKSNTPGPPTFSSHHPATTEIYTLSLHDALPISAVRIGASRCCAEPIAPLAHDHHHAFPRPLHA